MNKKMLGKIITLSAVVLIVIGFVLKFSDSEIDYFQFILIGLILNGIGLFILHSVRKNSEKESKNID